MLYKSFFAAPSYTRELTSNFNSTPSSFHMFNYSCGLLVAGLNSSESIIE
jgi:hypothetical protein